jgi:CHAD domain-containing protein
MKKLRWDATLSAAANSRAVLPGLIREYFEAGRRVLADPPKTASLHRFRLQTKAHRYTLELFQPCYRVGLQKRLEMLRQIQDYLGAINDYAITAHLIARILPENDPDRIKLEAPLAARAKRKFLELRRYWLRVFDAPGEERRWRNYLARPRE